MEKGGILKNIMFRTWWIGCCECREKEREELVRSGCGFLGGILTELRVG